VKTVKIIGEIGGSKRATLSRWLTQGRKGGEASEKKDGARQQQEDGKGT